jgi:hypothetical protein
VPNTVNTVALAIVSGLTVVHGNLAPTRRFDGAL